MVSQCEQIRNLLPEEVKLMAQQCSPDRGQYLRECGKKVFKRRDFECAQQLFEYASFLVDDDVHICHSNRAECFLKLGEAAKALDACCKALTLAPEHDKS